MRQYFLVRQEQYSTDKESDKRDTSIYHNLPRFLKAVSKKVPTYDESSFYES